MPKRAKNNENMGEGHLLSTGVFVLGMHGSGISAMSGLSYHLGFELERNLLAAQAAVRWACHAGVIHAMSIQGHRTSRLLSR